MSKVTIESAGSVGVIKDLTQQKLPPAAWTDAQNVRFLDGAARQFFGHGPAYGAPTITPYHVAQLNISGNSYWLYAGAAKVYAVSVVNGAAVHTNLTRQTAGADVDYTGKQNAWTSTMLSGIPILNPGNEVDPPQRWNLDIAGRFQVLDNWPANTFCKSLRAYKNFLVALNITRGGVNLGYMVKWSSPADPGGVPITWDPSDPTQDAGETDLAEGGDRIVDGLQLRDSFMIYKEQSVWRMDYTGGPFVFSFRKVLGTAGAMNRNCIVELDGVHFVLGSSDVYVHDGQSAVSVLDKVARRALFQDMDTAYTDRAFVFKNPFMNEVFVCYVSVGGTVPNKALVWNYVDKTVSYRDIPNLNHAAFGPVNSTLSDSWASDGDPWESDISSWNGPGFVPNQARVLMASNDAQLLLLDASATFNGTLPMAYLERRGLSFGDATTTKRITGVRLRVTGNVGETVIVRVGGHQTDPFADPEWEAEMEHVIGETIACDCFVDSRYPALRIESGTAAQWLLESYDYDIQPGSRW
ncbi:hypothetical protein ACFOHT_04915 [Massilia oculi]|uniref:Uncharacterized protein n=1 Tax=Massilia oculi TaxID=945844 RepID=A0A2S2DE92_9BURK|nr:hypothetical protein [Massilia oculi]AWL03409.1 hypothetical protein DIR46_02365 [Massilia oculi]